VSVLHVLRRELAALVTSPQTYAIAAAYLVLSGISSSNILSRPRSRPRALLLEHRNTLLVLVPVVAMRSFAESGAPGRSTSHWPGGCRGRASFRQFAANTL